MSRNANEINEKINIKHKLRGPVIFLGLIALAAIIYVCIYFYAAGHVGKPPF